MTIIKPATLHRAEDPRLSELAVALTGERVTAARYLLPAGVDWAAGDVHDVELGVEIVTGSGRVLALEWDTPGLDEGLSIAVRDDRPGDRVDVSDDAHWSAIVGGRVERLAVAFFEYFYDSSIRPWSFRVCVSGGACVTVALGEVDGSEISYLPDNVVVIFDEAKARDYRIAGGLQPAWGSVIE